MREKRSKATISLEEKETNRTVRIELPEDEIDKLGVGVYAKNYLWNLFADFCILNQEFMSYILSCNLSIAEYKLVLYLLSKMDMDSKVLINNQLIIRDLKMSEPTVIKAIKKLISKKIIIRQKIGTSKYEVHVNYKNANLNYDMLNPQMAYKGANEKKQVGYHKKLMNDYPAYSKQYNIEGGIDFINPETGEVFHQIEPHEARKHSVGTLNPKYDNPIEPKEAFDYTNYEEISDTPPALPQLTKEEFELIKKEEFELIKEEILKEVEDITRRRLEYMSKSEEPKPEPEPKRLYRVRQKEE